MQSKSTNPQPARAAIYCRVSSKGQEDNASLPTQRAACEAYAAEHGYQVVEVYTEVHTGKELFERPAMTRLRESMRRREFDVLIVYEIDRLSRNQANQGLILSECDHYVVDLESVIDPLEKTPTGRFLLSAKSFAAELEHAKIRERSMRGKNYRLTSGRLVFSSRDLYGYRRDATAGRRVIEPTEAAIVRQVYDWYLRDRLGMLAIANRLNAAGVPPPTGDSVRAGARWAQFAVKRLLTMPEYKGETFAKRTQGSGKRREIRAEGDWLRLPDDVTPAIVSAEIWDAAQRQRTNNRGEATRNAERPALLRGLIVCAVCGRRMTPETENKVGTRIYRCCSRKGPFGPCGGRRVDAEAIEGWVWDQIREALRNPDLLAAEAEGLRADGPDSTLAADRLAVQRQIDKLDHQIAKLLRLYLDSDEEDAAEFKRERAALTSQRDALRETLAGLDRQAAAVELTAARLADLRAYCATMAANLDGFGFAEKRRTLEVLNVTVRGSGDLGGLSGAIEIPLRDIGLVSSPTKRTEHSPNIITFTRNRAA